MFLYCDDDDEKEQLKGRERESLYRQFEGFSIAVSSYSRIFGA